MNPIQPVIIAGGSGTRLWPLSREHYPKQFLRLYSKYSLLQETILRLQGLDCLPPVIVCHQEHRFLVAEQLRELNCNDASILLEPTAKNTAPAIALAALHTKKHAPDSTMLVLAADHYIANRTRFHEAVLQASALAEKNYLVSFGIQPSSPETGYGYIQLGQAMDEAGFNIQRFVEKPSFEKAEQFLSSGVYLWNSGMFVFKSENYLNELNHFQPLMVKHCQKAYQQSRQDLDFIRIHAECFMSCPADSIDYAVMEKTERAAVVKLDCEWSDLGSWSSIWQHMEKDETGNAVQGDVIIKDSTNCYVHAEKKLVSCLGCEDLVIIDTDDAILVAHQQSVQNVKEIVNELKEKTRSETLNHRQVYRPWGHYDSIDQGHRYQVKRISVKPGAKLSLQMHHHRAEHWVVVKGTAKVTRGEKQYLVSENQSTFIPIGEVHALENPGCIPLELIEVQSGAYLDEDDIIRFEDRYGRDTASVASEEDMLAES